MPDFDVGEIRAAIENILDGYGSMQGYRAVWHTLQLKGFCVPHIAVKELLRRMEQEGVVVTSY
jgi:hypothetical protein